MAGREVREYTNLTDPKDKKFGKGKDKIDDEEITFQRMVAKGTWLLLWAVDVSRCRRLLEIVGDIFMGEAPSDSDDLLYLKEQMEAEEDAERLLRRTEKRAFAAFKNAANAVDSSPTPLPLPLRVEPKPKSGIRQQDLLKNIVEIRPKRHRVSSPSDVGPGNHSSSSSDGAARKDSKAGHESSRNVLASSGSSGAAKFDKPNNAAGGLLGLAYESSDED